MSKMLPNLSKADWKIMNICWKKGKSRAREIYDETLKEKKRSYGTVKTILDRLVVKGYLKRERFGPIWLYEPVVERSEIVEHEIGSFVDNVLNNAITPLFKYFAKEENITSEELKDLKKIIDDIE